MGDPMNDAAARIAIVEGDITVQAVDAIVSAANESLLGGGGVDGAIHRAAGPELLAECRSLGGCATGSAKIAAGYSLKSRHIIHAIGPVWHEGGADEDGHLAGCYRTAFALAEKHRLRSLAFPANSTGVFRFPDMRAHRIALTEARTALKARADLHSVRFVAFVAAVYEIYFVVFKEIFGIVLK